MWSHLVVALSAVYVSNAAYSQSDAFNALYYAYGAYCDADQLSSWDCKWCDYVSDFEIASNGVITGDSLQAFAGYDPDNRRIVASFRGTANIDDWMKDFDYSQTTYPYASAYGVDTTTDCIHSGFYDSWNELSGDGLTTTLTELFSKYPGSDILVTGHSLGAAIAQIAALEFKLSPVYDSYSIGAVNVITFGSPRWARDILATVYDKVIDSNWRIVNEDDIVPTVPYTYMSNGFHHSATEIRYTDYETLTYTQCDGSGEDSDCDYIGYSIPDHLHYLDLYEDCDADSTSSGSDWIDIDDLALLSISTTSNDNNDNNVMTTMDVDMVSTIMTEGAKTTDIEDKIIYKWKEGLDNVSKIALSIAVAIGW
eukprot:CAMPEP_0201571788 /NCGR_PEP_ID=MMETSP0190_2-20130828/14722_1 /ASSEMBLY_ACC=CAM_ASM_000263 /TAXON_ID=37353 /ORGANISM="Rosalina sp." /LENGTH=366 /DNA_ID=CAMNT_0047996811 /DNA_START=25 /DNA_END=1122 /DNA_ORIENTATION=+